MALAMPNRVTPTPVTPTESTNQMPRIPPESVRPQEDGGKKPSDKDKAKGETAFGVPSPSLETVTSQETTDTPYKSKYKCLERTLNLNPCLCLTSCGCGLREGCMILSMLFVAQGMATFVLLFWAPSEVHCSENERKMCKDAPHPRQCKKDVPGHCSRLVAVFLICVILSGLASSAAGIFLIVAVSRMAISCKFAILSASAMGISTVVNIVLNSVGYHLYDSLVNEGYPNVSPGVYLTGEILNAIIQSYFIICALALHIKLRDEWDDDGDSQGECDSTFELHPPRETMDGWSLAGGPPRMSEEPKKKPSLIPPVGSNTIKAPAAAPKETLGLSKPPNTIRKTPSTTSAREQKK